MERVKLSNSDLHVSPICLGCWQFNGGKSDINWNGQDPKVSRDIVDKSFQLGINFFDTAEAYGMGASEQLLGEALEGRRRDAVVATKFGNGLPNEGKYKAEDIENALNKSLRSLRTDYIDLYQIHVPIFVDDMTEAVAELKRQQSLGKIRYYAVSNFGPQDMKEFVDAGGNAVTNQVAYNLLWRSIEYEIVDVCDRNNVDILAYSPLQQGLLTGKFPDIDSIPEGRRRTKHFQGHRAARSRHGGDGAEKQTFQAISAIRDICQKNGNMSMTSAALSWLLAKRRVASVITGASRPEQMELNCKIVKLEKDLVSQLDAATDELKENFGSDADMWAKENTRIR